MAPEHPCVKVFKRGSVFYPQHAEDRSTGALVDPPPAAVRKT